MLVWQKAFNSNSISIINGEAFNEIQYFVSLKTRTKHLNKLLSLIQPQLIKRRFVPVVAEEIQVAVTFNVG